MKIICYTKQCESFTINSRFIYDINMWVLFSDGHIFREPHIVIVALKTFLAQLRIF